MRLASTTLLCLAGLLGCSSPESGTGPAEYLQEACDAPTMPAGGTLVTVDLDRQFQTMDGFGTTERVFDDPHLTETFNGQTGRAAVVVPAAEQARILAALYTELGLTRVRYNPRDPAPGKVSGIEPVNDNDNPNATELSKFDFSWKNNDAHIAYIKAAKPFGLKVFFASPLTLESWMGESNPEEYVEWAMAILRRWRDQGVEMPYYSIVNEPGFSGSGIWSAQWMLATTKLLGAKLRAEGFSTKLVIPDDLNPAEAYRRASVVLADPTARQYVGAIAYHLYGDLTNRDKLKALGETHSIPIWMTEYALAKPFEWAEIIHDEISEFGASAVDMQWGFFGQWEAPDSHLITIQHSGSTYQGWKRTKSFFTMGQYSRFVRPGAKRVEVTGANGIKVTAFRQGNETVIVAITPEGSNSSTVTFHLSGAQRCSGTAVGARTSASEDGVVLPDVQVTGRRFDAALIPGSVTTYVVK
jgi:O-glycosyl hydrolase